MASYDEGKAEVVSYIRQTFDQGATCLDVGACDGKWHRLLGDYLQMDACEIFTGNILEHRLADMYNNVYACDIYDLSYDWYDIIIFGDVIEHMTVERAQAVLAYARTRCCDLIIGVPFLYHQWPLYGNEHERHIQDDLTPELFNERYPGYELIVMPRGDYAYYHVPHVRETIP